MACRFIKAREHIKVLAEKSIQMRVTYTHPPLWGKRTEPRLGARGEGKGRARGAIIVNDKRKVREFDKGETDAGSVFSWQKGFSEHARKRGSVVLRVRSRVCRTGVMYHVRGFS